MGHFVEQLVGFSQEAILGVEADELVEQESAGDEAGLNCSRLVGQTIFQGPHLHVCVRCYMGLDEKKEPISAQTTLDTSSF